MGALANAARKLFQRSTEANRVAAKLPDLNFEALRIAGILQGPHDRAIAGIGTQFHSYEPYQVGDELNRIDWRQSAKQKDRNGRDMLLVKHREREVSHMIYLFSDGSKSMEYKAAKSLIPNPPRFTKKQASQILLLSLSHLAARSGERFTLLGSGLDMSNNEHGVDRIVEEFSLQEMQNRGGAELPKFPVHLGQPLPEDSRVVIISDFLAPIEEIKAMVKNFSSIRLAVNLVQVLDPAEIEFHYKKHVKFRDLEGGFSHTIKRAESARNEVEDIVRNHIRQVAELVRGIPDWSFHSNVTDEPLEWALLPLYGVNPQRTLRGALKPAALGPG